MYVYNLDGDIDGALIGLNSEDDWQPDISSRRFYIEPGFKIVAAKVTIEDETYYHGQDPIRIEFIIYDSNQIGFKSKQISHQTESYGYNLVCKFDYKP